MRKEDFIRKDFKDFVEFGGHFIGYHNLGNQVENAFANWFFRTKERTLKSFDNYVKSKGHGHRILTEEEYNKLK